MHNRFQSMISPRSWAVGAVLALSALALTPAAHADQVLFTQSTFFSGSDSETVAVNAPGAGTMSVTLTDLDWPVPLADGLSMFASNESSVIADSSVDGSTTNYDLTSAGAFYAHITGQAGSLGIPGLPNFGYFSVEVSFQPAAGPVPLPGSGWLLLAGLVGLAGLTVVRRGRPAPAMEPALF